MRRQKLEVRRKKDVNPGEAGSSKQSETSTGGSSQQPGWGESYVANSDADRSHPFKGRETKSKLENQIEREKALINVVKNIPLKLFEDLYYKTEGRPHNECIITKRKEGSSEHFRLRDLIMCLKQFKEGTVTENDRFIPDNLLNVEELFCKLKINSSGPRAFYQHITSEIQKVYKDNPV